MPCIGRVFHSYYIAHTPLFLSVLPILSPTCHLRTAVAHSSGLSFQKWLESADVFHYGFNKLWSIWFHKIFAELLAFEVRNCGGAWWDVDGRTREQIGVKDLRRRGWGDFLLGWWRAPTPTKAQGKGGWGALAGPMARIPRWRVEEGLGSKGTPTSIGATKRACCRTLWPQAHLVAPSHGLIATWGTSSALVVVEEGVATLNANDIITHRMQFSKTIAIHVIGCDGRMLWRI